MMSVLASYFEQHQQSASLTCWRSSIAWIISNLPNQKEIHKKGQSMKNNHHLPQVQRQSTSGSASVTKECQ